MSNVRELSQVDRLALFMRESVGVDGEATIQEMYAEMQGYNGQRGYERYSRRMQQRVGGVVSRINKKLNGMRIVPGERKRTYRLIKTA